MLKIRCSECTKEFIWTDDMPIRGKCPNPDCEGLYDVHKGLRENLAARDPEAAKALFCPACNGPITSRWTVCDGCGRVVIGSHTLRKLHLLFMTAVALLFLTLTIRIWMRF